MAKDLDLDSTLRYKIISKQENSPFRVDEKSGIIYLKRSINYETDNHLFISVLQASDGEFVSKPINLYFNILKENKNAPLFERIEYRFVLKESESINSELFCLKAKDRDYDKLTYKLHENDEKEFQPFNSLLEEFYFEVDSESGCVKLLKQFNVNEKDWFNFIVNVTDGQYHDYARVQIQVIKSESNKVKNFKKTLLIQLNESMRIGESICKFNDNVQIVNNSSNSLPFEINLSNELILKSKIDKMENSYDFQLEFSDSIQNVTVNILPNQIDQPIKFERNLFERSIFEDHKLNKPILELNFDSNLSDKLKLEIINGNLNDQFLIHRNQLFLRTQLDYEQIKKFSLKVKASLFDQQQSDLNAFATIQINVLNLIDQKPVFLNTPYLFKWCENQVGELGRFHAKSEYDLQSNAITSTNNLKYLLKNNDFDYFNLETNTGILNVVKEIDRENLKSPFIELSVLVIDELNANLQNEIQATIEIVNLNDNKPEWSKAKYEISLNEQIAYAKGFVIAELAAYDLDNDVLEYKLVNCQSIRSTSKLDQCSKLSLNSTNGKLYANEELIIDRELESEYNLLVEVNDGEYRSKSKVNIKITDENDSKPKLNQLQFKSNLVKKQMNKDDEIKFTIPYQYFTSDSYMTENDQLFLFGLSALDLDEWNSVNSKINFKLINSIDSRKLKLNKENGVLVIQNSLASSFSDKSNRSLKISALMQDCGLKNNLESKVRLDIEFYDFSQLRWMTIFEPPMMSDLQISESALPESIVYEFKLVNQNLTSKINLEIVGGDYDNRFKIIEDDKTFKLVLNRSLDYEYVQNYLIYLEATFIDNLTSKTNFQLLELNIKLINENDNEPCFSKSVYNVTIFEEQEPNLFVVQLEATDLDNIQIIKNTNDLTISNLDDDDFNAHEFSVEKSGINSDKQISDFRFELLTTNVPFRIDQYSGVLFTTELIDREKTGDLIQLQVEVQDDGGLKSQATVNVFVTGK